MSERNEYPAGVPCWVETLQPDPQSAVSFYSQLFGWDFAGPGEMPCEPPGRYFLARVGGRDVAGIGALPASAAATGAAWSTHVRVESAGRSAGGRVLDQSADGRSLD